MDSINVHSHLSNQVEDPVLELLPLLVYVLGSLS